MRGVVVAGVLFGSSVGVGWACAGQDGAGERGASAEARSEGVAKEDAKREGRGGLAERVRAIARGEPADPVLPEGEGVAIPPVIPPGEIVIVHECGHSMMPFGTGYWDDTTTVDLAKATLATERVEGDTAEVDPGTGTSTRKHSKHQSTLSPADVARIRAALDRVLAGGPYAPVYAYSEGIVCTLSLRVGEDPPFFRIDKSRPEGEDSVTRLIVELGVSPVPP